MPANILNLPTYTVTALTENDHDYRINAEAEAPTKVCPHCCHAALGGFGRREQTVRDLPMDGKRVGLYINTRRYRCKGCQKTFYESLPEIDGRRMMTNRLVAWIGKESVKRTFASIAQEVGVTEGTIRLIFKDYVSDLEKKIGFETPKWMGIDQIHLIKPRGVISNIQSGTLVELLPNRNKDTVARYLDHLECKDCIQYVAMGMWAPYRDACHDVIPNAQIIIAKLHVVKMANEAMERVRKGLRERLTTKQKRGLAHDRLVLLKRERDLSGEESLLLSGWIKNYDEIGQAYRLKEDFFKIYDAQSPDEAQGRYREWKARITPEVAPAFSELVKAWDNWTPWILGYFEHPATNAYGEALNNLIRVINHLGRGYSFEALRAKILFAEGAHKHRTSRSKLERRELPHERIPTIEFGMAPTVPKVPEVYYGLLADFDFPGFAKAKPAPWSKAASSSEFDQPEKNYGVDISMLAKMIEDGAL
ncbi:MAG: ISL3 family transposase [Acidiferrobacter sp.]